MKQHYISLLELDSGYKVEALVASGNTKEGKTKRLFVVTYVWPSVFVEFVIKQKGLEDKIYRSNTEAFSSYNDI